MRVSRYFRLGKTQAELDFVDVNTSRDMPLFVDPYAIEIRDDPLSEQLKDHIVSFFSNVLDAIRKQNFDLARNLMGGLREPDETCLGFSKGRPSGRGVGRIQAEQILAALQDSVAMETGLLEDLAESELYVDGISSDKVSDIATNVIRKPLIEYTQAQADLLGIPLQDDVVLPPAWNAETERWESEYCRVPVVAGRPVLLVPKAIVRRRISLDSQEFYNHHMISFLQAEYEGGRAPNAGLVRLLRNGRRVVYKKDVKTRHPFSKDALAEFITAHPAVLETYKRIRGAEGPLENEDLDEGFNERDFAMALVDVLTNIPRGSDAATQFHSFMLGALTFLMYPYLIYPRKEAEIHEGRKRIDLTFVNSARSGFFERRFKARQTVATMVMVECKNYTREIGNPELDQLTGRFGSARGWFGFSVCRRIEDRNLLTARCRDAARDNRGYIVALDDEDVSTMCTLIADGRREHIDRLLEQRFQALIA